MLHIIMVLLLMLVVVVGAKVEKWTLATSRGTQLSNLKFHMPKLVEITIVKRSRGEGTLSIYFIDKVGTKFILSQKPTHWLLIDEAGGLCCSKRMKVNSKFLLQ